MPCHLIALILGYNSVKSLRVTKNDKAIKSEVIWGKLESENSFQRQYLTKYLRLTLFFSEIAHNVKCLISVFQDFSASINKNFILAGRQGTRLSFSEV